jgi:hypothetical protein
VGLIQDQTSVHRRQLLNRTSRLINSSTNDRDYAGGSFLVVNGRAQKGLRMEPEMLRLMIERELRRSFEEVRYGEEICPNAR